MNPSIERIRQENEARQNKSLAISMHAETISQARELEANLLDGLNALGEYINQNTQKTQVVNPVTSVRTPDIEYVVKGLELLNDTVDSKNIDLTPLKECLERLEEEIKLLPKNYPEPKDTIEVSNLNQLETTLASLEKAVKSLDLNVEAPIVNIPKQEAPIVNIEKTDLKPVTKSLEDVIAAVRNIHIPEVPTTDLSKLEKEAKKHSKQLQELIEKPIASGGGGGGAFPFVNASGNPTPADTISLNSKKALVVANADGTQVGGLAPSSTATALNIFSNQSLTAAPVLIQSGSTRMFEFDFYNSNMSGVWIQMFNAASTGTVTLGATPPTRTIYVPPTSGRDLQSIFSNNWSTGLVIACTTTSTGNIAPLNSIQSYVGYV